MFYLIHNIYRVIDIACKRFQTTKVTFKLTQGHCYLSYLMGHMSDDIGLWLQFLSVVKATV